jgi:benzoate-CoA ligase family protein
VTDDSPGSREIGFSLSDDYNASEILFRNLEQGCGNKVAVYSSGGNTTYAELCRRACRIGNALMSLGLARSDRVIMFLDDTPTYPAAIFGAIRAGFVPVLISTVSPKDLIRFYLQDSGARVALIDRKYAALFDDESLSDTQTETIVTVNGTANLSTPAKVIDGDNWWLQHAETLKAADTNKNDMAFWMYSSGSTGRPKGVVHLQHDISYTAAGYAAHILHLREDDICFSVPKIFFAYGFGNSITFPFSAGASAVLFAGRPEAGVVFECVKAFRPTVFFGLPTLYTALINHAGFKDSDFSSVRLCVSAAEVLSAEVFNRWKDRHGLETVEGLGSTEVLHIYLSNTEEKKKLGAAGKRVPGYEIKLTDRDGNPTTRGAEGILWARGDSNAPCYWNRPDKTAETMRDGWIWTGDRFIEDENGFFFFRGRADDLIKVSGQWVYPLEIEHCLNEHPKVRECAVLAVALKDRRMTIKAVVALKSGVIPDDAMTKELQSFVKKRLLPHNSPRLVEYVDELPKTGTGKIDRQQLLNYTS